MMRAAKAFRFFRFGIIRSGAAPSPTSEQHWPDIKDGWVKLTSRPPTPLRKRRLMLRYAATFTILPSGQCRRDDGRPVVV